MDINKQPGISFDGVFLKDLNFSRAAGVNASHLDIKLDAKCNLNEDQKRLVCELNCSIVDKNKIINLNCTMVGLFSVIQGSENMDLAQFATKNAPAAIIPYVRELVSSTTIRGGLAPILFPPINIIAILESTQPVSEEPKTLT